MKFEFPKHPAPPIRAQRLVVFLSVSLVVRPFARPRWLKVASTVHATAHAERGRASRCQIVAIVKASASAGTPHANVSVRNETIFEKAVGSETEVDACT